MPSVEMPLWQQELWSVKCFLVIPGHRRKLDLLRMPPVLSIEIYWMLCEVMCVLSSMRLSNPYIDRRKLGVLAALENIPAVYPVGNVAKRLLRPEHRCNLRNPGAAAVVAPRRS